MQRTSRAETEIESLSRSALCLFSWGQVCSFRAITEWEIYPKMLRMESILYMISILSFTRWCNISKKNDKKTTNVHIRRALDALTMSPQEAVTKLFQRNDMRRGRRPTSQGLGRGCCLHYR
jgi:hypothetical protein